MTQWWKEVPNSTGEGWTEVGVELRYNWTDSEAEAAGWRRVVQGFHWRETLRHAGKVVLLPSAATPTESFDVSVIRLIGR